MSAMNKVIDTLQAAIAQSGLTDGMTVSFHHHLRNGDNLVNLVFDTIADMGIKDLNLNISSLFDVHEPLVRHIKSGVITGIETAYISSKVGRELSRGILPKPVIFRTHGGRAGDIMTGRSRIDVAFIGAPAADERGNLSGRTGKSACGGMGYAVADAMMAGKVIAITDNLVPHPLANASVSEANVDFVVCVDSIGDPQGIVSGTTKITRSPVRLKIAELAAQCIEVSGLLEDGFSLLTGAGGISLAVAKILGETMQAKGIRGSYATGGMTSYIVDMLENGCFEALADVQCFDLRAVESLRTDPRHFEITAEQYASPYAKSAYVDDLSVAVLGATEMDLDFNVNVHTDSRGMIMGGSGGHTDASAGAKMTMIVSPLLRNRIPLIRPHVTCVSTPGHLVDVLVTQFGVTVNPARGDLKQKFTDAGLKVIDMDALFAIEQRYIGSAKFENANRANPVIAKVLYRDGTLLDEIHAVCEEV